jgi:predicted methyltransferase
MKKNFFAGYFLALGLFVLVLGSCKGKPSQTTTTDTATVAPADNTTTKMPDTAVVISADDSLKRMLPDATKDFPGVTATVDQGIVTLTGSISRDRLPKLMMAVNALHPKKINNNLTINK